MPQTRADEFNIVVTTNDSAVIHFIAVPLINTNVAFLLSGLFSLFTLVSFSCCARLCISLCSFLSSAFVFPHRTRPTPGRCCFKHTKHKLKTKRILVTIHYISKLVVQSGWRLGDVCAVQRWRRRSRGGGSTVLYSLCCLCRRPRSDVPPLVMVPIARRKRRNELDERVERALRGKDLKARRHRVQRAARRQRGHGGRLGKRRRGVGSLVWENRLHG